jgi:hypothetical protein
MKGEEKTKHASQQLFACERNEHQEKGSKISLAEAR